MPTFTVSKEVLIKAELSHCRELVLDFKRWVPWSPWLSCEPDCKIDYAEDGKSYAWDGAIIGSGRMELMRSEPEALHYDLAFFKPWKSQAKVDFQFAEESGGTRVRWNMQSSLPFFMFFMKKMMVAWIGSDYERGLAKLKDYAESGTVPSELTFAGVGDGAQGKYVGIRTRCKKQEIGPKMQEQYTRLRALIDEGQIESTGAPLAVYHKFDMVKGEAEYTAAVPVASVPSKLESDLVVGELAAPSTFKIVHKGAYRHLGSGWSAGMMRQQNKVFRANKSADPYEVYLNDPHTTDERELVTEIHFPAK